MRILVVGGAGYVGSRVVPALVERGHEVEVVDLLWFGRRLPAAIPVRRADALSLGERDFEGFEQVVFLAGLSNDPMAEYSPAKNFVYNAAAPAYAAYLAKKACVRRFVFASSCSVYGNASDRVYDEDDDVRVGYPYGISKLQGERALSQLADDRFSVITLRKGTVCGHSPRMRFDLVVNTMFKTAVERRRITVNNPAIWRPILGMRDAVEAYVRSVEAPDSVSGVFNVASGNFTVGELGRLVRTSLEPRLGKTVELESLQMRDLRDYRVDCSRAARTLGFEARDTVDSIVAELQGRLSDYGDMGDSRYFNIEVFKALEAAEAGAPAPSVPAEIAPLLASAHSA